MSSRHLPSRPKKSSFKGHPSSERSSENDTAPLFLSLKDPISAIRTITTLRTEFSGLSETSQGDLLDTVARVSEGHKRYSNGSIDREKFSCGVTKVVGELSKQLKTEGDKTKSTRTLLEGYITPCSSRDTLTSRLYEVMVKEVSKASEALEESLIALQDQQSQTSSLYEHMEFLGRRLERARTSKNRKSQKVEDAERELDGHIAAAASLQDEIGELARSNKALFAAFKTQAGFTRAWKDTAHAFAAEARRASQG